MALGAELGGFGEGDEFLEFSPVRAVATQALDRGAVARILDLFSERVSRMLLPVMTTAAQVDDRLFFEAEDLIATMRVMAGSTLPFLNRFVLGQRALLALDRILMTAAAEVNHFILEEFRFLTGMGAVTGEASLPGKDRPMHAIFRRHRLDLRRMA